MAGRAMGNSACQLRSRFFGMDCTCANVGMPEHSPSWAISVSLWRSIMSKFVALTVLAASFVLVTTRPVSAGGPHPLCPSFWKDAWEDPFGCKAACAKKCEPAPAPTCPEATPSAVPATAPPAPPATDEAPPAPTTAQSLRGQQRSFSFDPAPVYRASTTRTNGRQVVRPAIQQVRADRKMRGF